MERDGDDQQHEHRRVGDRAKGDAIEERRDRQHESQRQRDLGRHREGSPGERPDGDRRERREPEIEQRRTRQSAHLAPAQQRDGLEQHGQHGEHEDEPDGAGAVARLDRRDRHRRVGDEIAERHEDDPRDHEDQHGAERNQYVDRPVGDPVLRQQERDFNRHLPGRVR